MKKLLFIFIAGITLGSCNFFDVETAGFVSPETSYKDEESVQKALVGVYAPLSDLSFYGRDWFYAFNLQDDLSYYDRNYTKQELFLNNYTYTNATLNNLWANLYTGIDRANSFLEYIQGSPIDETLIAQYMGEVRFLRAYYFFTLSSLWGDVPLRLKSTRDTDMEALQMPSTPAAEVFDFITTEMEDVVGQVRAADQLNGPGRISKSTVQGILARVYLKMGGFPLYKGKEAFEKAAYWARKVRNSRLHTLNPDYKEVFTNLSKDIYDLTYRESIWEIEFKGNNQDGHTTGGCVGSYNGVYNNQNDAYGFGYGYVSVRPVRRSERRAPGVEYLRILLPQRGETVAQPQQQTVRLLQRRQVPPRIRTFRHEGQGLHADQFSRAALFGRTADAGGSRKRSLRRSDDSGVRMYQRGAPTGQFRLSGCRRSRSGGFPPAHH